MEKQKLAPEDQHDFLTWEKGKTRGKLIAGALIVLFGLLYLFRELGLYIPRWIFSWEMILIGIGIVILIRHKFQRLSGFILIAIGVIFKLDDFYPDLINFRILFPIGIILLGASMIYKAKFGSRGPKKWKKMAGDSDFFGLGDTEISPDDFVDAVSIFGSIKKQVTTKNFKGADLFTLFGGSEINLMQADFQGRALIEMTTVFGGAEIIIPSDWSVRSEMTSIFGGLEDNRIKRSTEDTSEKILILKGTCVFGGVEIKSY
jgi:predicted membrane protein